MRETVPTEKLLHLVSRADAKRLGLKRYFVGSECPSGGVSERRASNGECLCDACLSASRIRKNAANKAFRAANPDTALMRERAHYRKHRSSILDKEKAVRDADPEAYADKRRGKNPTRNRERVRQWKLANPDKTAAALSSRRAMKRNAVPPWFGELDEFAAQECFSLARDRETATGIKWNVDHMVPLACRQASGLHCHTNLQVIPAYLNARKNNKLWIFEHDEWIGHI